MSLLVSARRLVRPFLPLLLGLFTFTATSNATIQYSISLEHPEQHLFHVTMTIPDVKGEVTVQMAAWNALYQIRDFSAHVQQVEAFVGQGKASVQKLDKQTWRIQGNGTITVRYATYWDEVGPFGTQLNGEHAFINPAMILLYIPDRRREAVSLNINMTESPVDWQIASAAPMSCMVSGRIRVCTIMSSGFGDLADGPIEIGKFQEFDLPGVSPRITVVVHGEKWRKKKIEDDLKRICEYEIRLMEGAPFDHYTFILHIGRGAGGGMEHSYSTAIGVPSDEFLSGVAAHEFFHLWNVKRIRPVTLEPVDYTKEQYTRALWFAEGITNTYGSYTLVRSGLWSKERFYMDLGEQITELEGRPANRWQSAEQSSLDAWLEKYALYNQSKYSVSYYTKGQVLGDLLDILIRDRTNNAKSLDDVLRIMNSEFAKKGKFYRDSLDVRLTAEKVAGGSFEEFFQKYVTGTEPFPYHEILAMAGLEVKTVEHRRATLGFSGERDASGLFVVRAVDPDGSASQAGLRVDDAVLTWNGGEVPRRTGRWAMEQNPGDLLALRVRRDDKELSVDFRLGGVKETGSEVQEDSLANEKARRIREGLLHGEVSAGAHP